jgi:hypothetical protein
VELERSLVGDHAAGRDQDKIHAPGTLASPSSAVSCAMTTSLPLLFFLSQDTDYYAPWLLFNFELSKIDDGELIARTVLVLLLHVAAHDAFGPSLLAFT